MVVETASAGDFVVVNWDNDYQRYGLFHRRGNGGYDVVSRDTGTDLRFDSSTGDAWFTRLTYEGSTGTEVYEVFRRDKEGRISQETRDSRVLAFDVKERTLAYARYRNGTTDVVVRKADKTETILGSFGPEQAVYGLQIMTEGTALVTLGTGSHVGIGILTAQGFRPLWAGSDILDACLAGQDRILFSSTLDGRPQLYWVDTAEDPTRWYQLTDGPGARFADASDLSRVTYSEYSQGGWYRCTLSDPFSKTRPIQAPVAALGAPATPVTPTRLVDTTPTASNVVVHADPFFVGWFADQSRLTSGDLGTAYSALVGWELGMYDAPGDWSLGRRLKSRFPSIPPTRKTP